jgi:CRP/FNR family transcriptional regulator, cyclic AMP receptor protein
MKKVLFILGELSDDDVHWLMSHGNTSEILPDTILIREGQPVDTLYILLEGTLAVSTLALTGREIARLSSGEVVGEMSFIDDCPPSATVRAIERSRVLAIPRFQLAEKLQQDVGFASRFYRALAILLSSRLRGTVEQLGSSREPRELELADARRHETVAIAEARFNRLLQQFKQINGD